MISSQSVASLQINSSEIKERLEYLIQQLPPHQQHALRERKESPFREELKSSKRDVSPFNRGSVSPFRGEQQEQIEQIEKQSLSIEALKQRIKEKTMQTQKPRTSAMDRRQTATFLPLIELPGETKKSIDLHKQRQEIDHQIQYEQNLKLFGRERGSEYGGQQLPSFNESIQVQCSYECELEKSNLMQQNNELEDKNNKLRELVEIIESKHSTQSQQSQYKLNKLQNKCNFLYSTLEQKDAQIKEVLLIQQKMIEAKWSEENQLLQNRIQQLQELLDEKEAIIKQQRNVFEYQLREERFNQANKEITHFSANKNSIHPNNHNHNRDESIEGQHQNSQKKQDIRKSLKQIKSIESFLKQEENKGNQQDK